MVNLKYLCAECGAKTLLDMRYGKVSICAQCEKEVIVWPVVDYQYIQWQLENLRDQIREVRVRGIGVSPERDGELSHAEWNVREAYSCIKVVSELWGE